LADTASQRIAPFLAEIYERAVFNPPFLFIYRQDKKPCRNGQAIYLHKRSGLGFNLQTGSEQPGFSPQKNNALSCFLSKNGILR